MDFWVWNVQAGTCGIWGLGGFEFGVVSNLRGFGFNTGRCLSTPEVGCFGVLCIVDCGYLSCSFVGCLDSFGFVWVGCFLRVFV